MWDSISQAISESLERTFQGLPNGNVDGGCINQATILSDPGSCERFFVKLNDSDRLKMFESEAAGLKAIIETNTIKAPTPICSGVAQGKAYLVLEMLDLGGQGDWREMGAQFALLHLNGRAERFGWRMDNFIGSTPQPNKWRNSWVAFYSDHRLAHQFDIGRRNGGHFPKAERLIAALPELLADREIRPSLLHGDSWSGNAAFTTKGEPVIYDVACYYGDPETDLAMTELFGGFPPGFYEGYHQVNPIDKGYRHRKTLYNLYHILNHFNLFGGHYQQQANQMIDRLLS